MVIVDTTVWIDYFRGTPTPHTRWLDLELGRQRLGITDLILCEVLQGIPDDRTFDRVRGELTSLEGFATGGMDFAMEAVRNYRRLRAHGKTVRKTMDVWIATFCIREGHSLLHNDRDFDAFERFLGLSVIHPD
ncbi:MAG: PIN domain nuclease [Nitrospirae bacterium]|nr:PIN domain nuclease [Nitrospirota bacterium]